MKTKKLFALVLSAIICLSSIITLPAYADNSKNPTLTDVRVLCAPPQSQIAYAGFTDLTGIILELSFSNGSKKKEMVYFNGKHYKAGEYKVSHELLSLASAGELYNYGERTDPLIVSNGTEQAVTSLTVFSIPSPIEALAIIKNFFEKMFNFGNSGGDPPAYNSEIKYVDYYIKEQSKLITNYHDFRFTFGDYAENHPEYNEIYFRKHNLVFIMLELPDTSYDFAVKSVSESEGTLNVKCQIMHRIYVGALCEICNQGILIETDKSITKLEVEKEKVIIAPDSNRYFNTEGYTLISSYDEFIKIFEEKAEKYPEYTEEFFKIHNLALLVLELPDPSYAPYVESAAENGDTLEVKCLIEHNMSGEWIQEVCYETILIETSKSITKIKVDKREININSPYDDESFEYLV